MSFSRYDSKYPEGIPTSLDMHFSDGTKLESGFIMSVEPGILAEVVSEVHPPLFGNVRGVLGASVISP